MTLYQQLELLEASKALVSKLEMMGEAPSGVSNQDLAQIKYRLYVGPVFEVELERMRRAVVGSIAVANYPTNPAIL